MSAYLPLSEPPSSSPSPSPECPRTVTLALAIGTLVLGALVAFFVTKAVYDKSPVGYVPDVPYVVPEIYYGELQLRMPYFGFTESLEVWVDAGKGVQRVSYFGGMDVYTFNAQPMTNSYTITPVYTTLTCLVTNSTSATELENFFPQLSLFTKQSQQETVTIPMPNAQNVSVLCDVWTYVAGVVKTNTNGTATWISVEPDANGYTGNYSFYVNAHTGAPVTFRSGAGHNVVAGGSHVDEYWLDYISILPTTTSFSSSLFAPPSGMTCQNTDTPFGPTALMGGDAMRSNPLHDIRMLFPHGESTKADVFGTWSAKYGKVYSNEAEKTARSAVFHSNLRFINSANRRGRTYVLQANHLADYTKAEKQMIKGRSKNALFSRVVAATANTPSPSELNPGSVCDLYVVSGKNLPDAVDWRKSGLVNPPKDQGTCGSCWSFGFTGAIEGAVAKSTGKLPRLSEQNIIDCSWRYSNNGCGGGQDVGGYAWLLQKNNGLLASDSSYGGYLNQNGFCHFAVNDGLTTNPFSGESVAAGANITACHHVNDQWDPSAPLAPADISTASLSDALANIGPISVSIDATLDDFYYYHSGHYYDAGCGSDLDSLDHTVLAVGYVTYNGIRYTIIRNSWSTHWGDGGYALISQKNNNCGVATAATFVSV